MGVANYNARFIPDFAAFAEPLRRLTKKGVRFEFGDEQRLPSAENSWIFRQRCQDSNRSKSSTSKRSPHHEEQQGVKGIISYASKSLSDVEKRYSQTEREALAMV